MIVCMHCLCVIHIKTHSDSVRSRKEKLNKNYMFQFIDSIQVTKIMEEN